MSEQMLKMKLQHLTNMETGKQGNMYNMYSVQYIRYVQCTVHVAVMSQCPSFFEVGSIQALK